MILSYFFLLLLAVVNINGECFRRRYHPYRHRQQPKTIFSHYVFKYVKNDIFFEEFTLSPGLSVTVDFNAAGAWNHAGQNEWPNQFPMCSRSYQSPVNIVLNNMWNLPYETCLRWNNYNDNSAFLTLQNTGTTLDASSTWRSGIIPSIGGGILLGTYRLSSIHFRWGTEGNGGSEHTINGVRYPLEMHLLHFDERYRNIENALLSDSPEALAVVAILFELGGTANLGIRHITTAMMNATSNGIQQNYLPLHSLGANFPDDYYTYIGSLTYPPCNRDVRWIVSGSPEKITLEELLVFQNLLVNDQPLVNNFRQIQPLNGRRIYHVRECSG